MALVFLGVIILSAVVSIAIYATLYPPNFFDVHIDSFDFDIQDGIDFDELDEEDDL